MGVDVFFVISGYLITVIILEDKERGSSSIIKFYERRVRRIVPALIVVVVSCCIAAWIIVPPDQMTSFAKTVLSLPVFGSNILFWKQSGYFEPPAEAVPLLHTWSLAVEEQFYVLFPIAIFMIGKFSGSRYALWLGAFAAISMGISIWGVEYRPAATFYLAPPRAWELLLGSLVAIGLCPKFESRLFREVSSLVALGLITWATLAYSRTTQFPGLAALPPTLGAAMLIHAGGCGDSWVKRALGWKPLVGVGLISYSLYLWHWPLIVFAQLASPFSLSLSDKWMLLATAIVLATLTWALVELPFRRKVILPGRSALMAAAGFCAVCLAAFSLVVIARDGVPERIEETVRPAVLANSGIKASWAYPEECKANYQRKFAPEDSVTFCEIGGSGPSTVLFWGNSQVEQLFPVLSHIAKNNLLPSRKIATITSGGCLPVVGLNRIDPGFDCDAFNRRVIQRAAQPDVDTVVLGSAIYMWSALCRVQSGCIPFSNSEEFFEFLGGSLRDELEQLAAIRKRILVLLPFPSYPVSIPDYLNKEIMFGKAPTLRLTRQQHLERVAEFAGVWQGAAAAVNATIVDPSEVLCPSNECVYRRGLIALYIDGSHLGAEGVLTMQPLLLKALLQGDITQRERIISSP